MLTDKEVASIEGMYGLDSGWNYPATMPADRLKEIPPYIVVDAVTSSGRHITDMRMKLVFDHIEKFKVSINQ